MVFIPSPGLSSDLRAVIHANDEGSLKGEVIERNGGGESRTILTFAAHSESEGETTVSFRLPASGKIITARADEADIVRSVDVRFSHGGLAPMTHDDKKLLAPLGRLLRGRVDTDGRIQSVFARVLGYMVEMAPEGLPFEMSFPEGTGEQFAVEGATAMNSTGANYSGANYTMAAQNDPSKCWEIGAVAKGILGLDWSTYLGLDYYKDWLKSHGWTYGTAKKYRQKAICGLSNTDICSYLGTIYTGSDGCTSTQSWPKNLVNSPVDVCKAPDGNTVRVGFPGTAEKSFCPGRCGPGCFGEFHEDMHNFSPVTYSAQCFAHDLCTGQVAGSNPKPNIFVGEGYACVDELINASWAYMNGPKCRGTGGTKDMIGWWRLNFKGKNRFFKLNRKIAFEANKSPDKLRRLGEYITLKNVEGNRVLQIAQVDKGWFFKSNQAVFSALLKARSGYEKMLEFQEGASTGNNSKTATFTGGKYFYAGVVKDSDGATVPNVSLRLLAVNGDRAGRIMKSSTNADGKFYWGSVEPYTKYKAKFMKDGFKAAVFKNVTGYLSSGALHEVTLEAEGYRITTSASPAAGGSVEGGGVYRKRATVTLTARPAAGYTFEGWTGGQGSSSANPWQFKASKNVKVTANFKAAPTATPNNCTYGMPETSVPKAAGCDSSSTEWTHFITITASSANCKWTATSDVSWLSIWYPNGTNGSGGGQLVVKYQRNMSCTQTRVAHISWMGKTFTLTQYPCDSKSICP